MRPERRADLNPVPRLRMYEAVYPFPHVSSCCAQGNLYLYYIPVYGVIYTGVNHHHHHHHISFMELGHLLTRSGLTYPEVSSKFYHDYFRQLRSSISLPWVQGVVMRSTLAYPTQQPSSPSRRIPCSHKRGNDDRVTAV